ncbi:hypothetical protein [Scytonema sp. UIC 10036]|nr:hypothetical protein [Scytonema sp. UIC 10036]
MARSIDFPLLTRPGHFPIGGRLTSVTFGTEVSNQSGFFVS